MSSVEIRPITGDDVSEVADFLHRTLNHRVTVGAWRALLSPPWAVAEDDHGVMLLDQGAIVGAYVFIDSVREIGRRTLRVRNLAAFCVREEYRTHSLLLVRRILKDREFVLTDLSPSGNVVAMNERLGFQRLDTTTRLVVNLPRLRRSTARLVTDHERIAEVLRGRDAEIFEDHRDAPAARHLVIARGDSYAYLVFRADRRKRLRLFASPLYAGGDRTLLENEWAMVRSHLLLKHHLPATLAERRILGFAGGLGSDLAHPRPKMYRGDVNPDEIDYLYSELALVSW